MMAVVVVVAGYLAVGVVVSVVVMSDRDTVRVMVESVDRPPGVGGVPGRRLRDRALAGVRVGNGGRCRGSDPGPTVSGLLAFTVGFGAGGFCGVVVGGLVALGKRR